MRAVLHAMARFALQKLHLYGSYSLIRKGPVHDDGWFRSFEEQRPVDLEGNPLPFVTYPAIEFLKRRVRREMWVFEFGCGASTLWWSARVARVVACEHNREWYDRISAKAGENVEILYQELDGQDSYARRIEPYGSCFDVVVIDGRQRVSCARRCLGALKPEGVILWDNSDREKYTPGYEFLHENGFRRIEFTGLAPMLNEKSETSVFYRPGNCLGI